MKHGLYLFMYVFMHEREVMLWKIKERSRIRAVQMDSLRGLLGIRRMDRVLNAGIKELCGVIKGVDKKIDQGFLRWFGHVEKKENGRIATRCIYEVVLVVAQWVGCGRMD